MVQAQRAILALTGLLASLGLLVTQEPLVLQVIPGLLGLLVWLVRPEPQGIQELLDLMEQRGPQARQDLLDQLAPKELQGQLGLQVELGLLARQVQSRHTEPQASSQATSAGLEP